MATQIKLQEPILDGGIRSINYFTGRLLTASDLSREKAANREADHRLGRALGEGVAYGLEVSVSPESKIDAPALRIEPGLAVNRMGQTLSLRNRIDLTLVRQAEAGAGGPSLFTECQPIQTGTYIAGQGVYLLTIAPAERREGRALVSGLGNEAASCNTDTIIESAQFRLIQLNAFLDQGEMSDERLLRNRVAYRCFGAAQTATFTGNPFGPSPERYGLLDDLRASMLSDCDAPLAVVYWTLSGGIEFVDMWAARRRLAKRATSGRWSLLMDDRRASEGEAMFMQFQDQIEAMLSDPIENLGSISATSRFRYLPPAALLPIGTGKIKSGFDYGAFFNKMKYRKPIFIEGAQLRPLLQESFDYPPIDVSGDVVVWLYLVRENAQASLSSAQPPQTYLVFASGHTPYRGEARYDVHHWNFGNFS